MLGAASCWQVVVFKQVPRFEHNILVRGGIWHMFVAANTALETATEWHLLREQRQLETILVVILWLGTHTRLRMAVTES